MENAPALILNIIAGFACIVMAELIHSVEMASVLLPFTIMFLVFGYIDGWIETKKLNKRPSEPPEELKAIYRCAQFGLFIFNIIAFLIIWLRPFQLTQDSGVWEMVYGLSIYGGFPLLVLYFDFSTPGKELARSRFRKTSA